MAVGKLLPITNRVGLFPWRGNVHFPETRKLGTKQIFIS